MAAFRGHGSVGITAVDTLERHAHEVFNELGKEEVIDLVATFAERVTAP